MAIATNLFTTFGVKHPGNANAGSREDVNVLTSISPDETPTLALLPSTSTQNLKHEWMTHALASLTYVDPGHATPASAGFLSRVEGDEFSAASLSSRTRYYNYVQRFRKDFAISVDTLELSRKGSTIGIQDEGRHRAMEATKEVNIAINAWLIASASSAADLGSASGDTAALSRMANLRYWGTQLGVVSNAGGAFGTGVVYGLEESMHSVGASPNTWLVSPGVKVDISRALINDTNLARLSMNQDGTSEYGPVVEVIRTDFGRRRIVVDRWLPQTSVTASTGGAAAGASGGAMFLLDTSKARVAWWRTVKPYSLPPSGDNMRAYVLGACTLEVLHPSCIGVVTNLTT